MSRVQLDRGLFGLATVLAVACAQPTPGFDSGAGSADQAIVNGDLESGWPGVGALTLTYAGFGYTGSFCSGTLIDPQWVLTAAHCLSDHSDYQISVQGVRFYVGNDARPTGSSGLPSSGALYQAGAFYVHPSYNPSSNAYDVGLVWLAEPATGVQTVPYNTADIGFMENSASALYVGFGVSNGATGSGSGVKRSTTLAVNWVSTGSYTSDQSTTGVCFGDSGGPGLYNFGTNDWRVIGINSTVGGFGNDPCVPGDSNQTRVDAHHTWVESVLSATAPDCNTDASICVCAAACQAAGWCDNTACQTASCGEIYGCMVDCGDDDGCAMNCYNNGSLQGQAELDTMYQCFGTNCGDVPDAQYESCIETNCQDEIDVCFPVITGDATCAEVYDCFDECEQDDATCQQTCYETGTPLAQEQLNNMWDCWDESCGTLEGDAWVDCVYEDCANDMNACWPPANCNLTGGDCDPGTACYPTATGANDCFTSDDVALGEACDPAATDRLICADGLICLAATQTTGSCFAFCRETTDCPTAEQCYLFNGSDFGYCDLEPTCTDADNDGYCEEEDCDDNNAEVNPGATESCADTIDNNCNNQVNEGCSACTDIDNDGYCNDVDCDDENPLVYPDAPENCADTIDNDCDSFADGADIIDCPSGCPDADGDGYPNSQCGGTDCNDAQPAWNPGADEVCTDTFDNNCNGQVNEGCKKANGADCTANDECLSGRCNFMTCVSPLPVAPPRRVDDDGGCSATGGVPALPLMALALLFLRRRRR